MSEWSRHHHGLGVADELARRGQPAGVVVDHLMSSWVVDVIDRSVPVVYLAHNHEASARRTLDGARNPVVAAGHALDGRRLAAEERRLVRRSALVLAITEADARRLAADGAAQVRVWPAAPPPPRPAGERARNGRALHLGSYEWRAKTQNLRELLTAYLAATPPVPFLDVAGPGPADVVPGHDPRVSVLGVVDEARKWDLLTSASVGVLYEPRGGGFKLKVLDYAAGGLPVVWLRGTITGFDLVDGVTGLEVTSADEVAPAAARLVGSDGLWQQCQQGLRDALSAYAVDREGRLALAVSALREVLGLGAVRAER